jgi:hypothetical protein
MSEDLDPLIQNEETELDPLLLRMDELRSLFVDQVITLAAKWFEDTAQFYVLKKSEVTLNMKKERLSEMKTRVKMLVKNSGKIVKDALSNPKFWWHMEPHKDASLFQYEQMEKGSLSCFINHLCKPSDIQGLSLKSLVMASQLLARIANPVPSTGLYILRALTVRLVRIFRTCWIGLRGCSVQ